MLKKSIHSIRERFMTASLTKKLICIYIAVILIPTAIMMVFFIHLNINRIKDSYIQTQNYRIESAKETLAIELNQIASCSNYFQQSSILNQMLSGDYQKTSDLIYYYIRDITPLMNTAKLNSHIQSVSIRGFGDYPLNMKNGFSSMSAADLDDELIEQIKKSGKLWHCKIDNNVPTLTYYRLLTINYYPYQLGIVQFDINISALADIFYTQTALPIYISFDKQTVCYDNSQFHIPEKLPEISLAPAAHNRTFTLPDSNIECFFNIPEPKIPKLQLSYIILFALFILVIFTVFYVLIMFLFVRRIKNFALHLKHSDAEKMEIFNVPGYRDELGLVIDSYNELVNKVNNLIQENLMVRIQKQESDYYALQAQIHPHFLYNILENIRMSAETHHDSETGNMLLALGKHMRYTLNMKSAPVDLKDELTAAKNYLQIHKIRMKEKLKFEIFISTEIDDVFCPRFVFQPLLENAISHGYRLDKPLFIRVLIEEGSDNQILVSIEDDGNGISEPELLILQEKLEKGIIEKANHVGLLNVNSRLMSWMQSPTGVLKLDSKEGSGTKIIFTLNKGALTHENTDCR